MISPRYVSPADTAKLLRAALKAAFPGVVFSVRTKTYSGGASVRVEYTDGPAVVDVEKIADGFASADFDGMTDSKVFREASVVDGERVRFGAHYVFVSRRLSFAFLSSVAAEIATKFGVDVPEVVDSPYGASLTQSDFYAAETRRTVNARSAEEVAV